MIDLRELSSGDTFYTVMAAWVSGKVVPKVFALTADIVGRDADRGVIISRGSIYRADKCYRTEAEAEKAKMSWREN